MVHTSSLPALAFLVAALLAMNAFDAVAGVYGQGDCLPPTYSVYSGGGSLDSYCGSLDPGIIHVSCIFNFQGSGNCTSPPPSVPGAAVDIPLDGVLDVLTEATCSGPHCDGFHCGPEVFSVPVSTNLHVTFNHEAGSTRYFDMALGALATVAGCAGVSIDGLGTGEMTIEDVGGGTYLFESHLDVAFADYACGFESGTTQFTLVSSTPVGVPQGQAPLSPTLTGTTPSPVRQRASIQFTLPCEGPVTLNVYDVSGRTVASLLENEAMPAGPHKLSLDSQGWHSGCYFYRLVTPCGSRTQAMIVIK